MEWVLCETLPGLANVLLAQGDVQGAEVLYREGLQIALPRPCPGLVAGGGYQPSGAVGAARRPGLGGRVILARVARWAMSRLAGVISPSLVDTLEVPR